MMDIKYSLQPLLFFINHKHMNVKGFFGSLIN